MRNPVFLDHGGNADFVQNLNYDVITLEGSPLPGDGESSLQPAETAELLQTLSPPAKT